MYMQSFILRAVNSITIGTSKRHITFWHRAMSASGDVEVFRAQKHIYASLTLYGWMVSLEWGGLADLGEGYFKTYVKHHLAWASYTKKNRASFSERLALSAITWLLSYRSVQRVIADEMQRGGAMCRVIKEAVESQLEGNEIERLMSDTVSEAISDWERNFEIDVDSIKGLDDAVREIIIDRDTQEEMASLVVELIATKLARR